MMTGKVMRKLLLLTIGVLGLGVGPALALDLDVTAEDVALVPLASGVAQAKLTVTSDGSDLTAGLPGAYPDGFVDLPITVPGVPAGTITAEVRLAGAASAFGPYNVGVKAGKTRTVHAADGSTISNPGSGTPGLKFRFQITQVEFLAEDLLQTELAPDFSEVKVTANDGRALTSGFVGMPITIGAVPLGTDAVTVEVRLSGVATAFGPYPISLAAGKTRIVDAPTGSTLSNPSSASVRAIFRFPILGVVSLSAEDIVQSALPAGEAEVKVTANDGRDLTGGLPGATVDGFASLPVDISAVPTETDGITVEVRLANGPSYGPYPLTVQTLKTRIVAAETGVTLQNSSSANTAVIFRFSIVSLTVTAEDIDAAELPAGNAEARIFTIGGQSLTTDFEALPLVISNAPIGAGVLLVEVRLAGTTGFGPYPISVEIGKRRLVDTETGGTLENGASPDGLTRLAFRFSTTSLRVAAQEFVGTELAPGKAEAKLVGSDGRDLTGGVFVSLPVTIPDAPVGLDVITAEVRLTGGSGPYPVSVEIGNTRVVDSFTGVTEQNAGSPDGLTHLAFRFDIGRVHFTGQSAGGPDFPAGVTEARITAGDGRALTGGNFVSLPVTIDDTQMGLDGISVEARLAGAPSVFGPFPVFVDFAETRTVDVVTGLSLGNIESPDGEMYVIFVFPATVATLNAVDHTMNALPDGVGEIRLTAADGSDLTGGLLYLPAVLPAIPVGEDAVSGEYRIAGGSAFGPFSLTLESGETTVVDAETGNRSSVTSNPDGSTVVTVRFAVAPANVQGEDIDGIDLPPGDAEARLVASDGRQLTGGLFASLPLTIDHMPVVPEQVTVEVRLAGGAASGPYPVSVELGNTRIVDSATGETLSNAASGDGSTNIRFRFPVAGLTVAAEDLAGTDYGAGIAEAKLTAADGRDLTGGVFVSLPVTVSDAQFGLDALIAEVRLAGGSSFGPHTISPQIGKDYRIDAEDGANLVITPSPDGSSSLTFRFSAIQTIVSAGDFMAVDLVAGNAEARLVAADGRALTSDFAPLPLTVNEMPVGPGVITAEVRLVGGSAFGPYPVAVALGKEQIVRAETGDNLGNPVTADGSTRVRFRFSITSAVIAAEDLEGTVLPSGSAEAKLTAADGRALTAGAFVTLPTTIVDAPIGAAGTVTAEVRLASGPVFGPQFGPRSKLMKSG